MRTSILAMATVAGVVGLPCASAAGFIDDSKASLGLRNFYFNQDYRSGEAAPSKAEEWGQGFILNFRSGYTQGPVGVGLNAIGLLGVKLDSGGRTDKAGRSRNPGQLFPLDHDNSAVDHFGSLGLTGKLRISRTEAHIGTLQPRLPVVVFNDGRLLPQTFEGGQITSAEFADLTLIGGMLEHAKGRASTDRQALSVPGNRTRRSNKFYYGGADYRIGKNLLLQYYYATLEDFYEQHFVGLTHTLALPVGSLTSDLRYFHSEPDGDNASAAGRADGYTIGDARLANDLEKGEVDSRLWSALFTYRLGGHALGLGYQQNEGDSELPYLNQSDGATSYTIATRQIGGFSCAGERVLGATYSYDFAALGLPGLSARVIYNKAWHIDVAGRARSDREWERDLRLDYVLQSGPLKGLGIAWANASLRSHVASQRDIDENRLIVLYSVPLF
ncbi:OprD family porin [Azotobacter salinestris]|uniref:OprD family porin n=1 Tax=Azotobacter salinestris TaxID=69964 RepID=UPI001266AF4E|nr:OprD family porin [Azotobacter salinestris]